MTLLEAYRAIGPLVGDPAVDSPRSEAGRVLLDETQRICRRLRFADDIKEDLPSVLLLKLIRSSVGGRAWRDPDSDASVVGWLTTALRHLAVDELRRRRGRGNGVLSESGEAALAVAHQPQTSDEEAEREGEAEATWQQLLVEIVPAIARELPASRGARFAESVAEMVALAKEEVGIADVVKAQGREPGQRADAAAYQQHHRARARLLEYVDDLASAGQVTPERAQHLRNAVRSLKRRT